MGGKGPGSCMAGSRGKNVPTPRSRQEQDADAPKTHDSDWQKLGEAKTKLGHLVTYSCRECGQVKVMDHGSEPPSETHVNRGKKR
jgi:uncharacterized caspase-like protein